MDYKELISKIKGHYFDLTVQEQLSIEQQGKLRNDLWDMETAITDLLARAEAAEAAQETLQRSMAEYKARAEKAERERDKCKAKYCAKEPCTTCIHYEEKDCEGDCLSCTADCPCNKCYDYSMWEWNGKKEE